VSITREGAIMYVDLTCTICGKSRGRFYDHSNCSKQLQKFREAKNKPKNKINKLTDKRINYLLKLVGE
jgi:hypothetical protein